MQPMKSHTTANPAEIFPVPAEINFVKLSNRFFNVNLNAARETVFDSGRYYFVSIQQRQMAWNCHLEN